VSWWLNARSKLTFSVHDLTSRVLPATFEQHLSGTEVGELHAHGGVERLVGAGYHSTV
jgi:hypothetical protein